MDELSSDLKNDQIDKDEGKIAIESDKLKLNSSDISREKEKKEENLILAVAEIIS